MEGAASAHRQGGVRGASELLCVCFPGLGARGRKPEPGAELRTWVFVEWSREVKESERRVVGRKKTL